MTAHLLTCVTEHLVLNNDLVAVQGLWVHFIVCILVGEVEQNLAMTKSFRISLWNNKKQAKEVRNQSTKTLN